MLKKQSKIAAVALLVATGLTLFQVRASRADDVVGTATVTAGTLTEAAGSWAPISVTLDGTNKTPTTTMPITVIDATGSGAGWNLTVTSRTFTSSGPPSRTLSTTATSITSVSSSCVATCTGPTNAIAYPVTVPAGTTAPTAVKFFNAASGSGMGQHALVTTFQVSIPANSFAGAYTSTFTFTIASAP